MNDRVGDAWPPPPLHYDPPSVQRNRKLHRWERRRLLAVIAGLLLLGALLVFRVWLWLFAGGDPR